jgi:hypothetical protein
VAKKIYESATINLVDGTELFITPLKLKYLRDFMDVFEEIRVANSEGDAMYKLSKCVAVAMRQYYPQIKTAEDVEDSVDLQTVYKIMDIAGGIKMRQQESENVKDQANNAKGSWEDLDLVALESEVFLLGIWKDYADLEESLSMPELMATLNTKRDLEYNDKKFLAAIQGVDLDKQSGNQNAWEEMKARVFSNGGTADPNDVVALQGANAQKAGFGIGMGLSYQKID